MWRVPGAGAVVAGAVALLGGGACARGGALGAPCRDNGDCVAGLYCAPGVSVCTEIARGADAAAPGSDAGMPGTDAAAGTDAAEPVGPVCGNGIVEAGEECDPTDVACDGTCHISPTACPAGVGVLGCGTVVAGANDLPGSTDLVSDYGLACAEMGVEDEWGPEVAYVILLSTPQRVTVDLTGLAEDLDVAVLFGAPPCAPATCFEGEGHGGVQSEQATFDALAWQPYFVVVDGYMGASSDFVLTVSCAPAKGGR